MLIDNVDLGSEHWNEALRRLQHNCLHYDRKVYEYDIALHKLRWAAQLDRWIKEAECRVQYYGTLEYALYKAWTGKTSLKP